MSVSDETSVRSSAPEALAGAKIVFWGESNAFAFKEDQASLIRRAADLARRRKVYLGVAVGVRNRVGSKPLENQVVLLDPNGDRVRENWKERPGGDRVLVSMVPTRGVRTLYSRIGDAFAWLCIAALVLPVGWGWRRRGQRPPGESGAGAGT
jgi:apolipoprotein N-acyltransferase